MAARKKHPFRRAVERFLVRLSATGLAALVRVLPMPWVRRLANTLGNLVSLFTPRRQRLAAANLEAAFGDRFTPAERLAIAREVSRNVIRVFLELFKLPWLDTETLCRLVPLENADIVRQALARGKGVILITGHFGNWELLGARLAVEGFSMAVVARDASDASTASLINSARERAGLRVFGRDDLRSMVRHLRRNGCLGILPDQHAKAGSMRMSFLGRPAWVARGPAMLALRTGCALIPAFCVRNQDGSFRAYVRPEITLDAASDREATIEAIMRKVNAAIEEEIRQRPDHWLWLHNRWKDADRPLPEPDGAPEPQ
jgi:KDO2-lipid IV(A) lauroyltransferase